MVDLFAPAANDQSIMFLYRIFGSMNGIISPPALGGAVPSTSLTLLGTMFKTFNSVILAVGALIVAYMTVVGVMKTAHEGQFMGRNWNSLWLPIRTVLGIAALVPTGSGYSGVQLVMMWVILQGVGAADTLWTTVLNYITLAGSPYGELSVPGTNVKTSFNGLFQGVMCAKSSAMSERSPNTIAEGDESAYYCNKHGGEGFCRSQSFALPSTGTEFVMGPRGACGVLKFCNEDTSCAGGDGTFACQVCKAQKAVLAQVIPTMAKISDLYNKADLEYQKFYFESSESPTPVTPPAWIRQYCQDNGITNCSGKDDGIPNPQGNFMSAPGRVIQDIYWKYYLEPDLGGSRFLGSATAFYRDEVGRVVTSFAATMRNNANMSPDLMKARDDGWILAGSYYHILARKNKSNLNTANPTIEYVINSEDRPTTPDTTLYDYRNNYQAAKTILRIASGQTVGSSGEMGDEVAGVGADAGGDVADTFDTLISPSSYANPINQLSIAGYVMLMVAQIVFLIIFILIFVVAFVGQFKFYVLGSGVGNPVEGLAFVATFLIWPLVLMLLGILVSVGSTLAIYVPLIPYILFTMGALNWLLLSVEAMVAGPLVALGILSPSGQHDLLGAAENGMWLLFHIFLRPSLMIFGLMAGMLLASVAVEMVNLGFSTVKSSIFDLAGTGSTGGNAAAGANPLAMIFVLVAYVTLIISVLNKCFSAIHVIPDRVMNWLGKSGANIGGEADAAGAVKGAVGGAAGQAGSQMTGLTQGAGKGMAQTSAARQQDEDDLKKGEADAAKAAHQQMVDKANKGDKG